MASVEIMQPFGTPTFEFESTMSYNMYTEAPVPQNEEDFSPEEEEDMLDMLGGASDDETEIDENEIQNEQDKYMAQMMGINIDDETPQSPVVETPPVVEQPQPPADIQSPHEIANTIMTMSSNLETAEMCSQIQKEVTKLVAAVRAKSREIGGVRKANAVANAPTCVDGGPRQRAPKGTAKATPAGIFNVAMRADATAAYMEGRRSAKELKTDTKASHIQSILAEMWKIANAETRSEFKRRADEKNASM